MSRRSCDSPEATRPGKCGWDRSQVSTAKGWVPLGQARKNGAQPQEALLDSTRAGEQGRSDHSPRPGPAALPEQSLLEQGHPLLHPGPRSALRL